MKKCFLILLIGFGSFFCAQQSVAAASESHVEVMLPSFGGGDPVPVLGAPITMATVVEVLRIAKDHYGLTLGSLVSMYTAGSCTVQQYLPDPAMITPNTYLVTIGGGSGLIVVLGDL